MKRLIPLLLGSLMLIALTGCESMQFSKFSGEQKSWPTGNAFTEGAYAVPVYRGWPEKPYDVIGLVQFNQPGIDWNKGDEKQAAELARRAGGDAIILLPKGYDPSPTTSALRQQLGITGQETVALAVKWK